MSLLLNGHAYFSHLNTRCELHGESKEPACDLAFTMNVSTDICNILLGTDMDVMETLYDTSGHLIVRGIKKLEFDVEFKAHRLIIEIPGDDNFILSPVDINKFSVVEFMDQYCAQISFRVQMNPTKDEIGKLAYMQQDSFMVTVTTAQPDLFDVNQEHEPEQLDTIP